MSYIKNYKFPSYLIWKNWSIYEVKTASKRIEPTTSVCSDSSVAVSSKIFAKKTIPSDLTKGGTIPVCSMTRFFRTDPSVHTSSSPCWFRLIETRIV